MVQVRVVESSFDLKFEIYGNVEELVLSTLFSVILS